MACKHTDKDVSMNELKKEKIKIISKIKSSDDIIKGSIYYAQFFIKAYQVYYRLRKISFGIFKGKNRMELKENLIGKLKWTDYLVAAYC